MSVQNQIDRLASAKAAIKTAIEGKGVTVPDTTLLDGFAELIEAIQAGTGIIIEKGTITHASDLPSIEICLDSSKWNGTIPQYVTCLEHRTESVTITSGKGLVAYFWERVSEPEEVNIGGTIYLSHEANITSIGYQNSNLKIPNFLYHQHFYTNKHLIDTGDIKDILMNNWQMILPAGVTFEWLAIGGAT